MNKTRPLYVILAAGLALAACAPTPNAPLAGLETLRPTPEDEQTTQPATDELDELAAASAAALDQLFSEGVLETPAPQPEAMQVAIDSADDKIESQTPTESTSTLEAEADSDAEQPPPPPPSLDERITTTAAKLAVLLRERGEAQADHASELALLAALDTLDADGLGPWLDPDLALLPPHEQAVAQHLRSLLRELTNNPDTTPDAIAKASDALANTRPIRITRTELCTRVEGFGRFNPLQAKAFLAGRPHRFIVYTESDGFRVTPLDADGAPMTEPKPGSAGLEPAEYRVEISQELLLYHDADGLLAWRRPAEVSTYTARSRVRDFFMVDTVTLPSTLTVGSYHLKVVIRDEVSGSVDEVILPIRVVADPNLTNG
ncbi:MAG: hypothetical protein AAGI53_16640 [Planctomycetota bacterium]